MSELISVICTVRNGETTISDTIESVLRQSYENWELIIVDDGSTDNTSKILNKFEAKDKRIRVYYSGGIGRGKALNKAINLATGSYIANIDADDLMHPNKLECQIKPFRNNKSLFLVSTSSKIIYENEKFNWKDININTGNITPISESLYYKNPINHSSVLMKKFPLVELGRYNEFRKSQLDYELWLRAFSANKNMCNINEELTVKRIHHNQSYENKKRIIYLFSSFKLQMEYLLKNKKYFYFLPIPIISFAFGILPFKYRRIINKKVFGEKRNE